jgi:hypothetical protein
MKKEYLRYAGLIFLIMGLIGIIGETGLGKVYSFVVRHHPAAG